MRWFRNRTTGVLEAWPDTEPGKLAEMVTREGSTHSRTHEEVTSEIGGGGGGGSLPAQWVAGPNGEFILTPDALDNNQTGAITLHLPPGTSLNDGVPIRIYAEDGTHVVLDLDAYGVLSLISDSLDPTNGGGGVVCKGHDGAHVHALFADAGDGLSTGLLGFFQTPAAAQQKIARPSGDAGNLWDVLHAYGLVAAP